MVRACVFARSDPASLLSESVAPLSLNCLSRNVFTGLGIGGVFFPVVGKKVEGQEAISVKILLVRFPLATWHCIYINRGCLSANLLRDKFKQRISTHNRNRAEKTPTESYGTK